MSHRDVIATSFGRGAVALGAAAALALGVASYGGPAVAQDAAAPAAKDAAPAAKDAAPAAKDAAPATEDAAPAAKDAKAPAGKQSAWVKLCEKSPLVKKDKDGKDQKEEKNICLTHHERLDGNSGMVLVSAAIRQVEGQDKELLMIMVPLGMALPPGIKTVIYTKDQWAKVTKNDKAEKIEEKDLKTIDLKYSLCYPGGCTAETEATKEILDQMKAGGGMGVFVINATGQAVPLPVPLDGFGEAFDVKPVDNAEYKKARGQLMAQIRQRQADAYEKFKADQMKNLPTQPGQPAGAAAAPAAKDGAAAPAEKK